MTVRKDHTLEFPMPVQPKRTWKDRLKCRLLGHQMPLRPLHDPYDETAVYVCERCGR